MLTIRLQRTGRSGHAQFRMVVQDSRFSPTSGRIVAYVGSYNPHDKEATLDVEKISAYMANGAQPSPRVVSLLKAQKVKLPGWVKEAGQKQRSVRYPEKRRSTAPEQPAEAEAPAETVAEQEAPVAETAEPQAADVPANEPAPASSEEVPAQEAAAEEPVAEEPSQEAADEPAAEQPAPEQ